MAVIDRLFVYMFNGRNARCSARHCPLSPAHCLVSLCFKCRAVVGWLCSHCMQSQPALRSP